DLERFLDDQEPLTPRSTRLRRAAAFTAQHWRALLPAAALAVATVVGYGRWHGSTVRAAARNTIELLFVGSPIPVQPERIGELRQAIATVERADAGAPAESFADNAHTTSADGFACWGLRRRLEVAQAVEELWLNEGRAAWVSVLGRLRADPRFAAFGIEPERDLVPLGLNPESGLEEFWHPASGERPGLAADGVFPMEATTGLVLVLLPPGEFQRGMSKTEIAASSADSPEHTSGAAWRGRAFDADDDCHPLLRVRVEPLYISKYEVTQGQWQFWTGSNPSKYRPGDNRYSSHLERWEVFTETHPLECVDAASAHYTLALFGLELPSESQWEYAARGGTRTRWHVGDAPEEMILGGYANVSDGSQRAFYPSQVQPNAPPFEDGYPFHGPVDAFKPNGFGLCAIAGNVWEWCRDVYRHDAHAWLLEQARIEPGLVDDRAVTDGPRLASRSVRGGAWDAGLHTVAPFDRYSQLQYTPQPNLGLRPVRRARWR
ncbi:MAG: formylglycine-generating enzyme family protein, partial [Planctomycetota bacterium]